MSLSRQVLTRIRRGLHAALADLPTTPNDVQPAPSKPAPNEVIQTSGAKHIWTDGLHDEIAFWDKWFRTRGDAWPEDYLSRLDPNLPLADSVVQHLPRGASDVPLEILDVGAGPLTILGKQVPGRTIRITPVDPLADVYRRIMDKHGVTPPVATSWCHGELLTERFRPNTFDLVWAQNSLDHSYDPLRIIEQALTVTRPGCRVVLTHIRNEALNENYQGLHQWNFDGDGSDFVIWNPRTRINVTKQLAHLAEIRTQLSPASVVVTLIKTAES